MVPVKSHVLWYICLLHCLPLLLWTGNMHTEYGFWSGAFNHLIFPFDYYLRQFMHPWVYFFQCLYSETTWHWSHQKFKLEFLILIKTWRKKTQNPCYELCGLSYRWTLTSLRGDPHSDLTENQQKACESCRSAWTKRQMPINNNHEEPSKNISTVRQYGVKHVNTQDKPLHIRLWRISGCKQAHLAISLCFLIGKGSIRG